MGMELEQKGKRYLDPGFKNDLLNEFVEKLNLNEPIQWLKIYDEDQRDIFGNKIKPNIFNLMLVLNKIKQNNYYFIDSEDMANFEVYVEKFREKLPLQYRLILEKFERNPNRCNKPLQNTSQQMMLLGNVLNWLAKTKCTNGKTYIENAMTNPNKWLQNKQLARELLTHNKIKGDLKMKALKEQISNTFIYHKDGKPLILAKNKKIPSTDSDNLSNYLATL